MDEVRRIWRRIRLAVSRVPDLVGAAIEGAPSALAGIATVVLAALALVLVGLAFSLLAALIA